MNGCSQSLYHNFIRGRFARLGRVDATRHAQWITEFTDLDDFHGIRASARRGNCLRSPGEMLPGDEAERHRRPQCRAAARIGAAKDTRIVRPDSVETLDRNTCLSEDACVAI